MTLWMTLWMTKIIPCFLPGEYQKILPDAFFCFSRIFIAHRLVCFPGISHHYLTVVGGFTTGNHAVVLVGPADFGNLHGCTPEWL